MSSQCNRTAVSIKPSADSKMQAQNVEVKSGRVSFLAKTNAPMEWRTVVSTLQSLVDDASFDVSPEGISLRAMDPSHVAMIDLYWPKSAFEQFECDSSDRFTVRVEEFAKLIKRSEPKDGIEISRCDNDSILLKIGNEFYKREFELHLLESDSKSSPLPKLTFDTSIVMSHSLFVQAVNDISVVSNHLTMRISNEMVQFSGKGDIGKAQATFDSKSRKGAEGIYELRTKFMGTEPGWSSATYNIEYLLKMIKSVGASSSETIKIEYSSKMPLRMELGLGEATSKGARIHFFLAPRVGATED